MTIRTTLYSIALFFAAASGQLVAQEMPKIMSPSPEAASVFKFGEIPVSLYTGVPNITVPIYEIEARGLTIPINLSYHARGIQVSEIASQVGLGWSLNYGGMVSRQIRGGRDEGFLGYLGGNTSKEIFFTDLPTRQSVYATHVNYPEYDFIPDQYFFSANGLSGKFVFDQTTGLPVIQKFDDTKIAFNTWQEPSELGYKNFVLTDGQGNKYYFGKSKDGLRTAIDSDFVQDYITVPSIGYTSFQNPTSNNIYSTWHIMTIETAMGEQVEFFYTDETQLFYQRSHDALKKGTSDTGLNPNPDNNTPDKYESHISAIRGDYKRISEIHFEKGKLVFTKTNPRLDLNGGKSLDKITLYNNKNTMIKEFDLKYEYTTSPDDENQNGYLKTAETHAAKRMFLKSVQTRFAGINDTLPRYRFKYNSRVLPNRHSNSIDLWGYYNGKPNGYYLKFFDSPEDSRAVDTLKAQAGMLEKIFTPEGGQTVFHYEHNKIINSNFSSSLVFKNPNPIIDRTFGLGHLDQLSWNGQVYQKQFTVGNFSGVSGSRTIWFTNDQNCFTDIYHQDCMFQVSYIHPNGNQYQWFKGVNPTGLSAGTYNVIVNPKLKHTKPQDAEAFNINLTWKEEIVDPAVLMYGGGKRIRKIEYIDSLNGKILSKTYSYTDPSTGKTSGKLLGLSSFYSTKETVNLWGNAVAVLEPHGAVPGSPLSCYQGNSLGYEFVTEYHGEGNNTVGKTEYRFTMTPDTGGYASFPYHPPTDNEWLRGKELSITHYKKTGSNSYTPVKKIENNYLYANTIFNTGEEAISIDVVFQAPSLRQPLYQNLTNSTNPNILYLKDAKMFRLPLVTYAPGPDSSSPPEYKLYHLTGGTVDLLSNKVVDYFDDGSQLVTKRDYSYDYDEHYNVKEVMEKGSDDIASSTKYFYANDTDNEVVGKPQKQNLSTQNMRAIPLVTQSFTAGQKLSELETVYHDWDPTAKFLLMSKTITTGKGTAATENRVHYNSRDDKGNPLEVQQEGGILISYIWGYNKTLPIAKIENFAYASIPASHMQAVINASNITPYSEANLLTALNNLRTDPALANAMVTTYTYKPLVGVTTITDPKGEKITYEYDTFNRLKLVRDRDNNILSENQYHYRPQN